MHSPLLFRGYPIHRTHNMNAGNKARSTVRTPRTKKPSRKVTRNPRITRTTGNQPRGPYATVGRDIGSLLGFSDLGDRVGGAIGRLFGKGDYKLESNSLVSLYGQPAAGPPPLTTFKDGRRGVRVCEREYIGDIFSGTVSGGSTPFTNASYAIQPANSATFPWLSTIASQFDQWEPHGIVFEFRSTSSQYNGSTQALGVVCLATDYDSLDSSYATKQEMENSDYAMSIKASDCAIHGVECSLKERPTSVLYTRSAAAPTSSDKRMYDLGNFQIATQGMSATSVNLGELWVSYDITLYKKQINTDFGRYHSIAGEATTAVSTSNYFGTSRSALYSDQPVAIGTDSILFPPTPGVYRIVIDWIGTAVVGVLPTITPQGAVLDTTFAFYNGGTGAGAGTTTLTTWTTIRINSTGLTAGTAGIILSGGTLPGTSNVRFFVSKIADSEIAV